MQLGTDEVDDSQGPPHMFDALTKVLVGLYEEPERPPSAVDYVRKYLGSSSTSNVDVDALRNENEELRNRIRELSRTVEELKKGNTTCR